MFKSLMTKGYSVIKDWLTGEEIASALEQYYQERARSSTDGIVNKNYDVLRDSKPHGLDHKISQLLAEVRATTDIHVDFIRSNSDYFDNSMVSFGWHQDHEPYYQYQNNYNLLNVWVPVIIPDGHSGLSLMPMDRLAELEPELWPRFLGKGAKAVKNIGTRTRVRDDQEGDTFTLNWSIDAEADTPQLAAGDLLLIRCDTMHRSCPPLGHRVSLSVRCLNSQGLLEPEHLKTQCLEKRRMIMANSKAYEPIMNMFNQGPGPYSIGNLLKR